MDVTNEWMDDTEKLLKSFSVGMDPEEASKLQEKTEVWFFLVCLRGSLLCRSASLTTFELILEA